MPSTGEARLLCYDLSYLGSCCAAGGPGRYAVCSGPSLVGQVHALQQQPAQVLHACLFFETLQSRQQGQNNLAATGHS